MLTFNTLLTRLCDQGKLDYQGTHYSDDVPVYTGDLWHLFTPELDSKRLRRIENIAEAKGVSLRFDDEIISDDAGRAHEIQPGFYGQSPSWCWLGDCEILPRDKAEGDPESFVDLILDGQVKGIPTGWNIDLSALGFTRFEYAAQSGFHPGQTDTPDSVKKACRAKHGRDGADLQMIVDVDDVGQFDVSFSVWYRNAEEA